MRGAMPAGSRRSAGRRRFMMCALALPWVVGVLSPARADLVATVPRIKPSVVAVGTYQRTRSPAFSSSSWTSSSPVSGSGEEG